MTETEEARSQAEGRWHEEGTEHWAGSSSSCVCRPPKHLQELLAHLQLSERETEAQVGQRLWGRSSMTSLCRPPRPLNPLPPPGAREGPPPVPSPHPAQGVPCCLRLPVGIIRMTPFAALPSGGRCRRPPSACLWQGCCWEVGSCLLKLLARSIA